MKPMRDVVSILPLAVEAVSFLADGRRLIDEMSFAMPAGGLTVLLGPNGAGKSLTLRLCHGLLTPSQGRIRWAAGAEGRAKRHAMVFQKPIMLRRSVEANIVGSGDVRVQALSGSMSQSTMGSGRVLVGQ